MTIDMSQLIDLLTIQAITEARKLDSDKTFTATDLFKTDVWDIFTDKIKKDIGRNFNKIVRALYSNKIKPLKTKIKNRQAYQISKL